MDTSMFRKWSELRGMAVTIPGEGRKVGVVEDFLFKAGTNEVDSLLVRIARQEQRALSTWGISAIEKDAVTLPHDQVLLTAIPVLPSGNSLLTYKIVGEGGTEVGSVGEIWLAVKPPVAMHIAALDLASPAGKRDGHARRIAGDEVLHYTNDTVVIDDQDARRLRS
jgi:sporulation protein YlmC with PRC-barrel domain